MSESTPSWKTQGSTAPLPPLAKGLPFFGHALQIGKDPVRTLVGLAQQLGPVFQIKIMGKRIIVLAGADANRFAVVSKYDALSNYDTFIGTILELGTTKNLAVLDGEDHKVFRDAAKSGYSKAAMQKALPTVNAAVAKYVETLGVGETFEVFPVLQRQISLQLARAVANLDVADTVDDLQRFMRYLMFVHIVGVWPKWTRWLPSIRRAKATSHRVAEQVVKYHQDHPPSEARPAGLIDDLLQTHAERPDVMPMDAVKAAAFGPFLAGQDTVAATTAFALYAIHANPDIHRRVQAEVDQVYAAGPPTGASFRVAVDLAETVKETLRLYPVAPFLPKKTIAEFELLGYRIPGGSDVYMFQTLPHFLPENYSDPWTFSIDRGKAPAGAFAPYGVGPHTCIGAGMGELQVIANIAALMHFGRFEMTPSNYVLKNRTVPLSPAGFCLKLTGKTR